MNDPLWYKDAVIYEANVKPFFDSNNDGTGDFKGLTQKLDYLQGLGITCLWLLPFFPSPLKDDGYDVADYRSVHPSYGTLEDFPAFLAAARPAPRRAARGERGRRGGASEPPTTPPPAPPPAPPPPPPPGGGGAGK